MKLPDCIAPNTVLTHAAQTSGVKLLALIRDELHEMLEEGTTVNDEVMAHARAKWKSYPMHVRVKALHSLDAPASWIERCLAVSHDKAIVQQERLRAKRA